MKSSEILNCNVMSVSLTSLVKVSEQLWAQFGAWFKQQREIAGLTQEQVRKKANIHVVQLSRIENGHSGAKRETVIGLVNAVNSLSKSHKIDLKLALNQAGFDAPIEPTDEQVNDYFERLKSEVMASGFEELETDEEREDFFDDLRAMARVSLENHLRKQRKQRSKQNGKK